MAITKTSATPYRRFQDPTGIVFIPWETSSTLGDNGYDIHDIVGDTVSLTQDDADRTEIPHEFSDDPLDENVSLGNKNLTMQCLDFQNVVLKNLFGWDTTATGFAAAPSQYKDLWCCVVLQFEGKSVVMPKVKMDSKTTMENMRTDIARGELSGVLYSTDVELNVSGGSVVDVNTNMFIMEDNNNFSLAGQTVTVDNNGDLSIAATVMSISPASLTDFNATDTYLATQTITIRNAASSSVSATLTTGTNFTATLSTDKTTVTVAPKAANATSSDYTDTLTITDGTTTKAVTIKQKGTE